MGEARILVGSSGSVDEYVLRIIVEFNRGVNSVVLHAYNDNICKLAEIYSRLKDKLGEDVKLVSGTTGTRRERGRRRMFLEVKIVYSPA